MSEMESTEGMVQLGTGDAALLTSPVGFGCMGLTAFYGPPASIEDGVAVLRRAYDLGVRHFDTAQLYRAKDSAGKMHFNEDLVGAFLASLSPVEKKNVTVATKFIPDNDHGGMNSYDKAAFMRATETSMNRLGVESLDLYYLHRIYPEDKVPVEVWMSGFKELVEMGKIKRIGISEAPAHIIRKAHQIHPLTCIQQEWSIFARDLEETIVPTCKELGIGIIAYSPIGRGFLAGKFKNSDSGNDGGENKGKKANPMLAHMFPYLRDENRSDNEKVLAALEDMAKQKNCTTSQLCLAWVIAKGAVPIPGTRNLKHVEDNLKALDVSLTAEDVQQLGELGNMVKGDRGNEDYLQNAFRGREKM